MKRRLINPDQSAEVDMTPMLDIVFIMLIFFIVTTSFVKESAITIHRPEVSDDKGLNKTILIEINKIEDVIYSGRRILSDSVRANVETSLSINPKSNVLVKIAESAGTGILVHVVDQVKLAGIEQVVVSEM